MPQTSQASDPSRAVYRIQVEGAVDEQWSEWFGGMTLATERGSDGTPVTTLSGPVHDQPALRGILNKLWDLNMTLVAVARMQPPTEGNLS